MKIFTQIVSSDSMSFPSNLLSLKLTFDDRKRARLKSVSECGQTVGIQIERGIILRDNMYLKSDDGQILKILASNESVSSAHVHNATLFARACYHLGNRHVPLQIGVNFLRYQYDSVLDEMLQQLGVDVIHENAPFEPEGGAYSVAHAHHHSPSHA
ncbi:urease accessory protein UreE [Marinibactrum halimedae]|uniref:Urease accessory protein UreE n=1 Tax=Marinibactrum halimedae TaxID=1444977 RepID=A0AA37T439_9GAMM|nr:urease accessory protein UreE [Marinibactrum halimedae]MCD9460843.1 urease accessory protein UreE [Marinibactrum halimedae]GLS26693.1 urease accessory protein UreE [Marinibactrum halimedae]